MLKKFLLLLIVICNTSSLFSQENPITNILKDVTLSGYVDVYSSFDTDKNIFNEPRIFSSLSPYRNSLKLNIAQISLNYNTEKLRSTLTLHYGDIPDVNWAPVTNAKFVQEANIGFSPVKNLWIDGGYFITHIGAESMPRNNFFSSFSLPSNAEPFLQSGIKISYEFSPKFTACLHLLNGFNVFEDNNKNKSAGVQLVYSPVEKIKFTYNNIFGNEQPLGTPEKLSMLNNFIINYNPCEKLEFIGAANLGLRENSLLSDTTKTAYHYGLSLQGRYHFTPRWSTAIRGDFFQDLNGISGIVLANGQGAKANSLTLGGEFKPIDNSYFRLEYRMIRMDAEQKIFFDNSNIRNEVTLSAGISF